jgi:hypothetical protein
MTSRNDNVRLDNDKPVNTRRVALCTGPCAIHQRRNSVIDTCGVVLNSHQTERTKKLRVIEFYFPETVHRNKFLFNNKPDALIFPNFILI